MVGLDASVDVVPAGSRVLMKIDVEGTEDEVLGHGRRFLEAFAPDIVCEILDGVADAVAVGRALAPHGYRYFLITDHGLVERPQLEPDARFRDWLFTRRDAPQLQPPVQSP